MVMVNYADKSQSNYLDQLLTKEKYQAKVNITVPHAYTALTSIINTDFITHSAMLLAAPLLKNNKIRIIESISGLPKIFQKNQFTVYQYWHMHLENNQENIWLRSLLTEN